MNENERLLELKNNINYKMIELLDMIYNNDIKYENYKSDQSLDELILDFIEMNMSIES